MTKAKRYEGERLRAEQWHNMGRDKAWEKKRAGIPTIEAIVCDKFNVYAETRYDPVDCGYLIVVEVTKCKGHAKARHLHDLVDACCEVLMRHEEPALEFPSDHLKTKLLLMVG